MVTASQLLLCPNLLTTKDTWELEPEHASNCAKLLGQARITILKVIFTIVKYVTRYYTVSQIKPNP